MSNAYPTENINMPTNGYVQTNEVQQPVTKDEHHHHGTLTGAVLGGLAGKKAGHGITGAVLGGALGHHHDKKSN